MYELMKIIKEYSPKRVLDVGCGIGFLVHELRNNDIDAYGTDFSESLLYDYWKDSPYFYLADAKYLPFEDKSFDLVITTDFFEHIPEGDIDEVVEELNRVGKKVISRIAWEASIRGDQNLYHVTNKSREWWEEKLKGKVEII
jgi:ubiquinone/menaquinone biosynthesis C-methylase UbiE